MTLPVLTAPIPSQTYSITEMHVIISTSKWFEAYHTTDRTRSHVVNQTSKEALGRKVSIVLLQ